jgi:hypothetical protein
MKNTFSLVLMALAFCMAPAVSFAQDPPPGIPLDGGTSVLAAAAIGFGVKKYLDYRKQQNKK